jgi:3-oxoacyl-[acyl-carrier-protein] synthase-3
MARRTIITGTGREIPAAVVTNFDLEKVMNTTDEWIQQRSGIRERHYAEGGVGSSELAAKAAAKAIASAGIDKDEIDFIIAATLSPDYYFPGIGVQVQAKLGLAKPIGALDVRDQCSGFIYALSVADQFIRTGTYKKILLCAAEVQSHNLDYSDEGRDMAVLFGDGGAAVILEPNDADDGRGILSTHLFSDGRFADVLWMENPGSVKNPIFSREMFEKNQYYPRMDGKLVFKNASERMPEAVKAALEASGLGVDDVTWLVPHQANDRISQMVAHKLRIPIEKVIRNIDRFGNTTAASIPIAIDEAIEDGRVKRGDLVVATAFGSGFTWAAAAIRW